MAAALGVDAQPECATGVHRKSERESHFDQRWYPKILGLQHRL
jgi:hypothetical protein